MTARHDIPTPLRATCWARPDTPVYILRMSFWGLEVVPEKDQKRHEIKAAIGGSMTCDEDGCEAVIYKDERDYCPRHSDV